MARRLGNFSNARRDDGAGAADARHRPRRACRWGFTLIELLVVIAIIAALAAILFPVFAKVLNRSRNAGCVSNLHQLGMAMMTYADDNDERLPVGLDSYWKEVERVPLYGAPWIYQTLADRTPHELWRCPADQGFKWWSSDFERPLVDLTPTCYQATGQSYDYNLLFSWDYARRIINPIPVSRIRMPGKMALLKDAHFSWHNSNHPLDPKNRDLSVPPSWNVVYLDGHVESRKMPWYRDYMVDTRSWWFRDNNPRLRAS
jgi:prepilin-type N-terminal cleavage/methylation domain-containing protein